MAISTSWASPMTSSPRSPRREFWCGGSTSRLPISRRARDFAPGFKVGLQQKDLRLALEAADELHLPLAGTAFVHQLFAAVERRNGSDVGTQALVQAVEALAGLDG